MYDDTINGKCRCTCTSACTNSDPTCNCEAYCKLYERAVASFGNKSYVTISPDPRHIDGDYQKLFEEYRTELFKKLYKVTNDFIVVLELAGFRPHFHCIFDVKDQIGFNIKLLNHSKYNNVKKHGPFKGGLHYIFKEADKTYRGTGIVPILEWGDIEQDIKLRKERLEQQRREHRRLYVEQLNKEIPKWMTV